MFFFSFCDSSVSWQFGFQDPATPVAEGIFRFHHDLIFILIFVVVFVSWILFKIIIRFQNFKHFTSTGVVHGTLIEIIWTIIPAVILMLIAVPSFALLYSIDETVEPSITLKVLAHQWYWSYEYSDYSNSIGEIISFDSYLLLEDDLQLGDLRLLEVDNRVGLPVNTHVRFIITSSDVLHCWAVPSFGVKIDACPGRLNEVNTFIQRYGVFFGQCSEICGINHGFMPISVEVFPLSEYLVWLQSKIL